MTSAISNSGAPQNKDSSSSAQNTAPNSGHRQQSPTTTVSLSFQYRQNGCRRQGPQRQDQEQSCGQLPVLDPYVAYSPFVCITLRSVGRVTSSRCPWFPRQKLARCPIIGRTLFSVHHYTHSPHLHLNLTSLPHHTPQIILSISYPSPVSPFIWPIFRSPRKIHKSHWRSMVQQP